MMNMTNITVLIYLLRIPKVNWSEVQNNNEYAYFQRMLFGTSKLVTEYINRGESYGKVRKVYSVNIVYFSLGHGKDLVYHGKAEFRSIHTNDIL